MMQNNMEQEISEELLSKMKSIFTNQLEYEKEAANKTVT